MDATELRRRMGITSGSRFNAARRLTSIDRSFNLILSLVSVMITALTVIPLIYDLDQESQRLIIFLTLAASIAILVITNLNSGSKDLVQAEQLHRCALEVNEIARKLDAAISLGGAIDINRFAEEYGSVLQKYSVNHEKVDYLEHRIHRRSEFKVYEGKSGRIAYLFDSLVVAWQHNMVWMIGLGVLGFCLWLILSLLPGFNVA